MVARPLRYFRIVRQLIVTSIQTQAQYRLDFVIQAFLAFFWVTWNVAPLVMIFEIRPAGVGGWSLEQAMLVMSAFLMLKAALEGIISPNLVALVEHVRKGTFDFVLLKPADAQVLVSISRFVPAKLVDFLAGMGIAVWSIARLDPTPSAGNIAAGVLMLVSGGLAIYAIWMILASSTFWFVKVDNLVYLFSSLFDAARWPISVFRGWIRVLLTFVLPVAVMTSYPAMALIGQLDLQRALIAWATTLVLLLVSRRVFRWSLRHYSSASS